jgi:hypothetical protein
VEPVGGASESLDSTEALTREKNHVECSDDVEAWYLRPRSSNMIVFWVIMGVVVVATVLFMGLASIC